MGIPDPTDPRLIAGEVDFYCAACGYNLRGLAGDPKRCPECGHLNPIELLIIPAEAIQLAMRRLETAPTMAFVGLLMLAGAALLLLVSGAASSALGVFGALCLFAGVSAFAHECQYRRGWVGALLRYSGCATLILIVGFGIPVSLLWLAHSTLNLSAWGDLACVMWLALLLLGGSLSALPIRVLYRTAQATIRELQREAAVQMAREAHRLDVERQLRK
jgi:predicted membrane protein